MPALARGIVTGIGAGYLLHSIFLGFAACCLAAGGVSELFERRERRRLLARFPQRATELESEDACPACDGAEVRLHHRSDRRALRGVQSAGDDDPDGVRIVTLIATFPRPIYDARPATRTRRASRSTGRSVFLFRMRP
ncbi:MAG: hypothetical protein WD768_09350 [Phycisphaeraceae bacterium]